MGFFGIDKSFLNPRRIQFTFASLSSERQGRFRGSLKTAANAIQTPKLESESISQTILAKSSHAQILRSEDREAFETLMDACRSYASAGGNAVQPVLFEPMVMSILLSHQIELQRLRKEQDEHKHSCKAP